jgi:hypothetical protein
MIGVEHIGTGPDHLAFVLALILIAARLGEVATVITGFTVAHSITLAVAALGLARPESQEIGALVGLSIVLVAAENAFLLGGRPRSIPVVVVLGLGAMVLLSALGVGGIGPLTLVGMTLFTLCYFRLPRSDSCTASDSRESWSRSLSPGNAWCPRCSASTSASRWDSWSWSRRSGRCSATWLEYATVSHTACWWSWALRHSAASVCSGS